MSLFDCEPLFRELSRRGADDWATHLRTACKERFTPAGHGNLPDWINAWNALPESLAQGVSVQGNAVQVPGELQETDTVAETLMRMHPWRKGPFHFQGIDIDTEWRSGLKWDRLSDQIDFRDKTVLDVGSGNGYYGWRMLNSGADLVVGLDPMLLFVMQFEVFRRYATKDQMHFVLPGTDADLPPRLHFFDITFSMGVLYHRTSPIDHLQSLWHSLGTRGKLVIETLVIESEFEEVLVPEKRYAQMRNVWFLPSVSMLQRWLRRTGFVDIKVVDVSPTTSNEQRTTEWMKFNSLSDFLDPNDATRTVEGYPSPVRAILTATRGN